MSRSVWKVPFMNLQFLNKTFHLKKVLFLWKRNSLISSACIDKTLKIYNGSKHILVRIKTQHINLRLGQLASTTVSVI